MKKIFIHLSVFTILSLPVLVFAEDFGLKNPINVNSISDLILIVARVVRYIAIPFVVIAIMYSGYLYIASQVKMTGVGIADAHKSLKYTIIGAFILLSAELVALVMKNTIESLTK